MYQDNAYMSFHGTQWYSLPSYYTASGNQQNVRVQDHVPSYLTPEASVSYQYQSMNPVNQYLTPETTSSGTIHQYGLTDHRFASHYRTSEAYFDESSSDRNSCQNYLSSIIIYGTQATYAKKDHSLEAFVRAICVGDIDLYANTGGSKGQSQSRIRKQYGNYSLKDPRIRRMVSRARHSPYKKSPYPHSGQSKNFFDAKCKVPPSSSVSDRGAHGFPVLDTTEVESLCSDFLKCSMSRAAGTVQ